MANSKRPCACILSMILLYANLVKSQYCFNASEYVLKQTGFGTTDIWGAKAQDVEQCMVLCVRLKRCQSMNYNLETNFCELNDNFRKGSQSVSYDNLYSEFRWWPSEVDKNCFSRPCKDNEVCIPGTLLASAPTHGCSNGCMPMGGGPVCPLPKKGVSNGRTVGSVNVVKCREGWVGGGSAKCMKNKELDKDIDECVEIHNYKCENASLCNQIGAGCIEGKCQCLTTHMYNEKSFKCIKQSACGKVPEIPNGVAIPDYSDMDSAILTCNDGYETDKSKIICQASKWESATCEKKGGPVCPLPKKGVSNGRTVGSVNVVKCREGWFGGGSAKCMENKEWDKDIDECVEIHNYKCENTSLCTQIGAACIDGKCQCPSMHMYNETSFKCYKQPDITAVDCSTEDTCSSADKNSVCDTDRCVCKTGYTAVGGTCAFSDITAVDCSTEDTCSTADKNSVCDTDSCVCKTGYTPGGGTCVLSDITAVDCSTEDTCSSADKNSVCDEDRCVCKTGYTADGGTCALSDITSVDCSTEDMCSSADKNSVCGTDRCVCKTGYTAGGGTCALSEAVFGEDISEFNGESYRFIQQKKSWYQSKKYCRQKHEHLVNIKSEAENDFIVETITTKYNDRCYWTGGRRIGGVLKWLDGTVIDNGYTNWSPVQPGSSNCLALVDWSGYNWYKDGCNVLCSFICELI